MTSRPSDDITVPWYFIFIGFVCALVFAIGLCTILVGIVHWYESLPSPTEVETQQSNVEYREWPISVCTNGKDCIERHKVCFLFINGISHQIGCAPEPQ